MPTLVNLIFWFNIDLRYSRAEALAVSMSSELLATASWSTSCRDKTNFESFDSRDARSVNSILGGCNGYDTDGQAG